MEQHTTGVVRQNGSETKLTKYRLHLFSTTLDPAHFLSSPDMTKNMSIATGDNLLSK